MKKEDLKAKLINELGVTFKGEIIHFPKSVTDYDSEFLKNTMIYFNVSFLLMVGNMPVGIQIVRLREGNLEYLDTTRL